MERKITGTLEVSVDPQGMEARLTFTPKEGGEEWDVQGVMAFLEKKRIKEGYNTASVDSLFPAFMKTLPGDPPITEIIATGKAPGEGTSAIIAWEEYPVPDYLEDDAESFFQKAPAPEFYNIRIEKIQKNQNCQRKKISFSSCKRKRGDRNRKTGRLKSRFQ